MRWQYWNLISLLAGARGAAHLLSPERSGDTLHACRIRLHGVLNPVGACLAVRSCTLVQLRGLATVALQRETVARQLNTCSGAHAPCPLCRAASRLTALGGTTLVENGADLSCCRRHHFGRVCVGERERENFSGKNQ